MLQLKFPEPVKRFVGAFWNDAEVWQTTVQRMQDEWGPIDITSATVPFTSSDYYEPEMGGGLYRQFLSFRTLARPDALPKWKLFTNTLEEKMLLGGARRVNLDVGYLDYQKVVLASTKRGGHKIYMANGIWADLTLLYHDGRFHDFPWTFADFQSSFVHDFLIDSRDAYKSAMRRESRVSKGGSVG